MIAQDKVEIADRIKAASAVAQNSCLGMANRHTLKKTVAEFSRMRRKR